jgi:DNA polymerase-1
MKRAMLLVDERLKSSSSSARILLQVHDELLLEVPEAEIEAVAEVLRQGMEDAGALEVPLKVDIGWGATWAEAH